MEKKGTAGAAGGRAERHSWQWGDGDKGGEARAWPSTATGGWVLREHGGGGGAGGHGAGGRPCPP